MIGYIKENPKINPKEIGQKLQKHYGRNISKECIRNHMDGLMFILKDSQKSRKNSEKKEMKRSECIKKIVSSRKYSNHSHG